VTIPFAATRTNAVGTKAGAGGWDPAAWPASTSGKMGMRQASRKPPPLIAETRRKVRRSMAVASIEPPDRRRSFLLIRGDRFQFDASQDEMVSAAETAAPADPFFPCRMPR